MKSVNLDELELVELTESEKQESNGGIMLHPLHIWCEVLPFHWTANG